MFWDSSALVTALLDEPRSRQLIDAFDSDPVPVIWWGTPLECHAAVVRAVREKRVSREEASEAAERLREARTQIREVAPLEAVRTRAMRLLSAHPLRTADSLQLAASLIWCEEQPASETFVCLDQRLREAARREGFALLPAEVV
jgi:predicted nucleic acid-binding protein